MFNGDRDAAGAMTRLLLPIAGSAVLLLAALAVPAEAATPAPVPAPEETSTRVVVTLDHGSTDAVVGDLPDGSYDDVTDIRRLPVVSLDADATALAALADDPRVASVQEDHTLTTQDVEANAVTGATDAHDRGWTGAGTTVAIIDTGVDETAAGVVHPGLADDLVGQACFRTEGDCPAAPAVARDEDGHGTHVAGIVTGPDGVAPDADVYAMKVFGSDETTTDTDILAALARVVALNTADPGTVDLVNLSLGGDTYASASQCDADNPAYATAFAALEAQGVTVFAATGNDGSTSGVSAPACVTGAVGVGSTDDGSFGATYVFGEGRSRCTDAGAADRVSCYSNATSTQGTGELVDVLAPGCMISSLGLDGDTDTTMCGTSMASPYAAGSAALVLGYARDHDIDLTPAELEDVLESSGASVVDQRTGVTYPRVAPLAAIESLSPSSVRASGLPDGRVARGSGALVGDDVYGDLAAQTVTGRARAGRDVRYVVSVQNDGDVADRIALAGGSSGRGYTVRYRTPAGATVTGRLVAGTFRTPSLAPGATYELEVVVTPTARARRGRPLTTTISLASEATSSATDAVRVVTRRAG
jgi:subtilisin family serine protease